MNINIPSDKIVDLLFSVSLDNRGLEWLDKLIEKLNDCQNEFLSINDLWTFEENLEVLPEHNYSVKCYYIGWSILPYRQGEKNLEEKLVFM